MSDPLEIVPDWRWGTAEGSRDLDRLLDRRLTFREKLEWLEEAEELTLRFRAQREQRAAAGPQGESLRERPRRPENPERPTQGS